MAKVRLNGGGSEKEDLTPVVRQDELVVSKRSLGQKFADAFISDAAHDVKSYVLMDVIIPGVKDTIINIMEMIFFGNSRGSRHRRSSYSDNTSYRAFYQSEGYDSGYGAPRRRGRDRDSFRRNNERIDYQCIVVNSRSDAEDIVDTLKGRIERYGEATKSDLFELVDIPSTHVDNNWGWVDTNDIGIRRVQSGYLIDVADAVYLD